MKAKDIIKLWRHDVDDTVKPGYLWSDEEALDYLDDAVKEAARRARLLVDSEGTEVARITLEVGTAKYPLDPRVLFVRKARMSQSIPMRRMNEQDMASIDPYWEDASPSVQPSVFITDTDTGSIRFWPTPSAAGTVFLTVVRDPMEDIDDPDDTPEINARYHRSLRFWMTYRAHLKPDEETYDPKKAEQALALFEQEFGKKSSAIDENWIAREQFEGDGTF